MTDCNSDRPNPENSTEFSHDNLDWLAFCYLADEMNLDERADFEARLESDSYAQQALVDAVQQTQVLYASLESTSFNDFQEPVALAPRADTASQNSFARTRILFASAAALLVFVAGWAWFANSDTNGSEPIDSDRLASAWVETLDVMSDEELGEFIEFESTNDFGDDGFDNWMLVALTDIADVENGEGVEGDAN